MKAINEYLFSKKSDLDKLSKTNLSKDMFREYNIIKTEAGHYGIFLSPKNKYYPKIKYYQGGHGEEAFVFFNWNYGMRGMLKPEYMIKRNFEISPDGVLYDYNGRIKTRIKKIWKFISDEKYMEDRNDNTIYKNCLYGQDDLISLVQLKQVYELIYEQ